jgi:spore maturation protein CgeB
MIGLQNYQTQVTQRTYEILGSGGFLLTSDIPAVRELFIPDKHFIVSSNPDETKNRVRYFLKRPELREKIRSAGMEAVKVHSYKQGFYTGQVIVTVVNSPILDSEQGPDVTAKLKWTEIVK